MAETLTERINDDMKQAMRSKDTARRDVLRYLRSAIKNREIELRRPADEAEVVEIVQNQIKQRRDSIDAYEKGGRADRAESEQKELDILEEYLPDEEKPLDDETIQQIVAKKADELGVSGPSGMRLLMPALIQATAGRADNRLLSKLAADELQRRETGSS